MYKKSIYKAIISIAVAMVFVMPVAAFANVGTFGVTSNSENTVDIKNMVESSSGTIETCVAEDLIIELMREPGRGPLVIDVENPVNDKIDTSSIVLSIGDTIYVDDDNTEGPWDGSPEHPYQYIQDGVDNAEPGDTIYVFNGIYYENVIVDKQLDLVGESRENMIIDGGNGRAVKVIANYVSIDTFTVTDCLHGIDFYQCSNGIITNCTAYDNSWGIIFSLSSNCIAINCDTYNNDYGIYLSSSSNSSNITNCNIYNNINGMSLGSSNTKLRHNSIYDNDYNLDIRGNYESQDINPTNTINGKPIYYLVGQSDRELNETHNFGYLGLISCTNITAKNSDTSGIVLVDTTGSTISGVSSRNNVGGIYLWMSSNNDIINCDVYNNDENGIYLYDSSNNNIINCDVYNNNNYGIWFYDSSNNDIINCDVYHNGNFGIYIYYSSNNNIINCNVYSNVNHGICISRYSEYNNVMYCIAYSHAQIGISIATDASNNFVSNCDLYDNRLYGLACAFDSDNINITNCNIYNNGAGIKIWESKNNILTNCNVYNNSAWGIDFCYISTNSVVTNCTVYNNAHCGISLWASSGGNLLHHNDVVDNGRNVCDSCSNTWDDGYPSGGNFWSDYEGEDKYSGHEQNEPGSDGIGDTPYISWNAKDNYPFMLPLHIPPPLITNVVATPEVQSTIDPVNITCTVTDDWDIVDTVKIHITGPEGFVLETTMNAKESNYWYESAYPKYGVYYYYIWANDTLGSESISDTYSFGITDVDTPISSVDPLPTWETTVTFTVKATAYDNIGVVSATLYSRYSEDGTDWSVWTTYGIDEDEPWSWSFTGSSDGYYEFYSIAVDDIGNVEDPPDVADASTGIDTVPPHTEIILDGTMGENGWYVSVVNVTITASDILSGVEFTWYRIDSEYWKLYTVPFTVGSEGKHTVEAYSFDRASHREDVKSASFKNDKTLPLTEHEFDGVIGKEGWFVGDVAVTLNVEDVASGVNYTMYNLSNGIWTVYTDPFNITENGEYTLCYYSVDRAGNTEPTKCVDFKIEKDLIPPVTTHEFDGIIGDNDWFTTNVVVVLTAEDNASGVDYTKYKIDDGTWINYTGSFLVTEDYRHKIVYYSVDKVKNEEAHKGPFDFNIDQTVPTIDLTWDEDNSKLVADVADETSGIAKVEFYVNDEYVGEDTTSPYEWEVTNPRRGDKGQAIVYDNAGNKEIRPEIDAVSQSHSQSQSNSNSLPWPFSWLLGIW